MEKTVSRKNFVKVVGYLKENLLENIKDKNGDNVIRGSLIIATNDIDSHKIQFYVKEFNRNNEKNEDYDSLLSLLPENTISIASYLKNTPTANFAVASSMATKVWATGRFDEFAKRDGEREISSILLKGNKAGIRSVSDASSFVPGATFISEVYISSLEEETDGDEPTGRAVLVGYLPTYNGGAHKITFVAPKEDNIAKYILANYKVSDTVILNGDLISAVEIEAKNSPTNSSEFFGRSTEQKQYTTKFVRERRIFGGSKTPIHQGEEGSISTEEMKQRLIVRNSLIEKNSQNSSVLKNSTKIENIGFTDTVTKNSNFADLDF